MGGAVAQPHKCNKAEKKWGTHISLGVNRHKHNTLRSAECGPPRPLVADGGRGPGKSGAV